MPNAIKGSGNKEDAQYEAAMLITEMPNLAASVNPCERDDLMRKAVAAGDPLAKKWAAKNGLK